MALDYIVPRIAIDETISSPRPNPKVSLSTIGIVGTFQKGPLNKPISIKSIDQFINTFGEIKQEYTGAVSAIGAFNQGANDFVMVRVGTPESAKLELKDAADKLSVTATAASSGEWGNALKVAVATGTQANTVKLVVINGKKSRTYDNITLDSLPLDPDVMFEKSVDATTIPKILDATSLAGGTDGTATESDYIGTEVDGVRTGLKALEPMYCNIVIAAQQSSSAIHAALTTHTLNAQLEDGLRIAIYSPPKGSSVDSVVKLTETLDNMRGIFAYPYFEPVEFPRIYVAPDGYFAGRIATLGAHESPSNKSISGILSTEKDFTMSELRTLTNARIMPVSLVRGRGFCIRNGLTLSMSSDWSQVNIRRIFDKIEMLIYNVTQWAVSEPNTRKLWQGIATQIDNVLQNMKANNEIYDYKPTICDEVINTPENIQARILTAIPRVRPIYAADFIDYRIQRLVGNEK